VYLEEPLYTQLHSGTGVRTVPYVRTVQWTRIRDIVVVGFWPFCVALVRTVLYHIYLALCSSRSNIFLRASARRRSDLYGYRSAPYRTVPYRTVDQPRPETKINGCRIKMKTTMAGTSTANEPLFHEYICHAPR
jgi:hypothetical protein